MSKSNELINRIPVEDRAAAQVGYNIMLRTPALKNKSSAERKNWLEGFTNGFRYFKEKVEIKDDDGNIIDISKVEVKLT